MTRYIILALSLLLVACKPSEMTFNGYVEGEFVFMAPTSGGLLETLFVERGQEVALGDKLFSLDLTELYAARNGALANVGRASAELEDLMKGERPEEIEIILQQKEQAQAKLLNTRQEYDRVLPLSKVGDISISERDSAKAALDSAIAQVAEVEARIQTAHLSARIDRINAARATLESAEYALAQADKRLKDAAPHAPAKGFIEDTFFRQGEYIAPGNPVVSLLPPENVKIRFFVPQKIVPQLKLGQAISVRCDGCSDSFAAKISYIAPRSEYTPPVIYSVESREKLVFLIEAKPEVYSSELRPGLPVDVDVEL